MGWVDRYRAGDHAAVWREIAAVGPGLRDASDRWEQARVVAEETMRRVRGDVERIHDALLQDGYEFARGAEAVVPPEPDATAVLDDFERLVGPVPLALRSWIEIVGAVSFVGQHPNWNYEFADPLEVECAPGAILTEYRERTEGRWFEETGTNQFPLAVAADYLHKADVSGGPPYAISLPSSSPDPPWEGDDLHRTTFLAYLRSAILEWGGFPGWARREPQIFAPHEPWPDRLREIVLDLERF